MPPVNHPHLCVSGRCPLSRLVDHHAVLVDGGQGWDAAYPQACGERPSPVDVAERDRGPRHLPQVTVGVDQPTVIKKKLSSAHVQARFIPALLSGRARLHAIPTAWGVDQLLHKARCIPTTLPENDAIIKYRQHSQIHPESKVCRTHPSNCAWSLSELTNMNSRSSLPALFLSSLYVCTRRGVKARQGGHLAKRNNNNANLFFLRCKKQNTP